MKIIQVNVWLGRLINPLVEFIAQEDPDVLCCQEVLSAKISDPLFADMQQNYDYLKKAGPFEHAFFSPTYGFRSYGEKVYIGNAIFSKFPLQNLATVFTSKEYVEEQTIESFQRNIRNVQICEVKLNSQTTVTIANHHGYHDLNPLGNQDTAVSMQRLANSVKNYNKPLILCGDLNITPDSPSLEPLNDLGLINLISENKIRTTLSEVHRAPQQKRDRIACDYIFVSPDVTVKNFMVSDSLVSDHKALVLEFDV